MKKKNILVLVFLMGITLGSYAFEIERLTFLDSRPDGSIIGTVTVNAVFMAYSQQRISIEGNQQIIRESVLQPNGQWTDWQVMERAPQIGNLSLRQIYDNYVLAYSRHPRMSRRIQMQEGLQAVRILSIPTGRSSPIWWSDDGRSFNVYYEFWAILP